MTALKNPAHVPSELVRDFNYLDLGGETDIFAHYQKLHDGPDFFYTPHNGGHWVATRFEDMEYITGNNKEFSSHYSSLPKNPFPLPLLESDEPIHTDYRNLLQPFFTPKSINELEVVSRNLTNSLIDEFIDKGECDFPRDFGQKMPIMILMSLLDLPSEDTAYLLQISEDIVRSGKPEVMQAAYERVFAYVAQKVIPARKARPGSDIFSALIQGTVQNGRHLSEQEILALGSLLIGAGLDTVASMLGFIALFLARNPEHRRQLIDHPDRITNALEEIMRRHHIANIARMVISDMTYKGVQLKAGDVILIPTPAAGIDERRYPDPLVVDFDRKDRKSLVFGRGAHQCIGNYLARTELRVFLAEWLKRIPDFEVKAGEQPVMALGKANAVRYLPLTWKATGTA